MKKILVTGASGFVGSNLCSYLKENSFSVVAFDRKNPQNLNNFDIIIHLAGKAHDLKNVTEPKEYYDANFELTKNLYEQFLKSKAQKFIFMSTVKAVADSLQGTLKETAIPNPQTHYGKSKLLAEKFIQEHPIDNNKKYFILRPCMIHGPGNKGNLNLLYKVVSMGIPWPLASFQNSRSFLSIGNLNFIVKELIERDDISSDVFQLSDDQPLSTNSLISIIAQSINRKPLLWNIRVSIIKTIAKIGDKIKLPLNSERLKKLTESYVVSNEKIKNAIGKDLPLSTEAGLYITLNSFNKNA